MGSPRGGGRADWIPLRMVGGVFLVSVWGSPVSSLYDGDVRVRGDSGSVLGSSTHSL